MTKKKGFIFFSLLPVILIVGIILFTGYLLLADDIKLPSFDNKPKIRRLEGFPQNVYTDKQMEKQRLVIKSDEELNNFLNTIDNTGLLTLKEKIDFNKEYVIAVTAPNRNIEGHEIKIRKVYMGKDEKELTIAIYEYFPGEECTEITDPHIALDIVTINKSDYEIQFDKITETRPCKN